MSFDNFLAGEVDESGLSMFPAVNYLLRYESLNDDLEEMLRLLGVEQSPGAGASLSELVRLHLVVIPLLLAVEPGTCFNFPRLLAQQIEKKKFRPTSQAYTVDRMYVCTHHKCISDSSCLSTLQTHSPCFTQSSDACVNFASLPGTVIITTRFQSRFVTPRVVLFVFCLKVHQSDYKLHLWQIVRDANKRTIELLNYTF